MTREQALRYVAERNAAQAHKLPSQRVWFTCGPYESEPQGDGMFWLGKEGGYWLGMVVMSRRDESRLRRIEQVARRRARRKAKKCRT